MGENKILDFFDYLKKDKVSAEKFRTITEKLSTVKNGESAKKLLEEELMPFAKSKGYDITYEDFLNFTKSQDSKLSDDILEMASGGRSELWNRMGQSLLIFGTGAGLFAGATYGAMGGFGGGNSKSAENRSAEVQTVDQNRTKSSINNIRKELQNGSKESEINKELGTREKDNTYASSYSTTRSSGRFRNTGARLNRGTNSIVKAKGAYTNKTDNLETKPRIGVNKVSSENKVVKENENKKTTEKLKKLVKPTAEKSEVKEENKVEKVSDEKIILPEVVGFEKKDEEKQKEDIKKYTEVINNKVLKDNAGWISKIVSLGFYKNIKLEENVDIDKIVTMLRDLDKFEEVSKNFKIDQGTYAKEIEKAKKDITSATTKALTESKNYCERTLLTINDAEKLSEELKENQKYLKDLKKLKSFSDFKSAVEELEKTIEEVNKKSEGLTKCRDGAKKLKAMSDKEFKLDNLDEIIEEMDKVFEDIKDSVKSKLSGKYTNDIETTAKNIVEKIKENLASESTKVQQNGSSKIAEQANDISKKTRKVIEKINNITGSSIPGDNNKKSGRLDSVEKVWTDLSNIKNTVNTCNNANNIEKGDLAKYRKELSDFSKKFKESDIINDVNTALGNIQKKLNEKILPEKVGDIVKDKSGAYTAENYVAKLEDLVSKKSDKDFIDLISYCEKNVKDFGKKISTNKVILEYIILGNDNDFKDLKSKFEDTIKNSYTNDTFKLDEIINFVNKKKASLDFSHNVMKKLISEGIEGTFKFVKELIKTYKDDDAFAKDLFDKDFIDFLKLNYKNEHFEGFINLLNTNGYDKFKKSADEAGIFKINKKSAEEHKEDIENILKNNVTDVNKLSSSLGTLIDSKDYDGVYKLIETAYALTNKGNKTLRNLFPGVQTTMSSENFVTLMNNKKLINFLEQQSTQEDKGELFNKIKELFNKEEGGIKKYLSETASTKDKKTTIDTVKKLNSLFNPETAKQEELNRLLKLDKHNEEELKFLNDEVKSIITSKKDVKEKLKGLNDILSQLGTKKAKTTLENILSKNKDELAALLANDGTKKAETYKDFEKLFNETIRLLLGEDKVVELDDIINYSKPDKETKDNKLSRDGRLAKSGNFEAIKNRINNAIINKEVDNVMQIVAQAYSITGSFHSYGMNDFEKIIEESNLKNYLLNESNKDKELYKKFSQYFNKTLKKNSKNSKVLKELEEALSENAPKKTDIKNKDNANQNDEKDILERLDNKQDLKDAKKIGVISEELKKIIEEAKTAKENKEEKLNKVFKVIEKVYNDTGNGIDVSRTFGIDQLTQLIKDNCDSLVKLLKDNKKSYFYNNFKDLFYKKGYFIENGLKAWINDQKTKEELEKVLPQ